MKTYAGIGSRETPHDIALTMKDFAGELANKGIHLRSGHGANADQAFELGAFKAKGVGCLDVYVPWLGFEGSNSEKPFTIILGHPNQQRFAEIAEKHHPNWGVCTPPAKHLLTRNVPVILGLDLKSPVDFVIGWTQGRTGGTVHTMAIARANNIPVFNLADQDGLSDLLKFARTL